MLGLKACAALPSFFLVCLALGCLPTVPSVDEEGQVEECLSRNAAPSVPAPDGLAPLNFLQDVVAVDIPVPNATGTLTRPGI